MASIIKADNIQKVSDGTNIIKKCGSTITLGSCGATIALACGATQTGFGRTGTVDWCTTAKTAPFTGVSGKGYFVNTTCGSVTVTLPATPSAGDIISIKDYAGTFQTNSAVICNNGSKINGVTDFTSLVTQAQAITLIYVDATKGWQDIQDSTSNVTGAAYVAATGGTEVTCGNYKIHTFTSDGCFSVSCAGNSDGSNTVDYLVVAGGGGSGKYYGGGGGGGGYRESKNPAAPWTASPLASATSLPVSATTYPITVGGGGATAPSPSPGQGTSGSNSVFSSITSTGGGYGNGGPTPAQPSGGPGGSGGGGHSPCSPSNLGGRTGGTGNTPPVSPPQGQPGVTTTAPQWAGAGGGASATGAIRVGGAGTSTSINGTPIAFSGGGSGGPAAGTAPSPGAAAPSPCGTGGGYEAPGTTNRGGGAGSDGGNGGSGIVIIRYKYQ